MAASTRPSSRSSTGPRPGCVNDARGRRVRQNDPVRMYLLGQGSTIPAHVLRTMAEQLMPDLRRQRAVQIAGVVLSLSVVVGGTWFYFRYRGTWSGFDPVNTSIYVLQMLVIVAGPVVAWRIARARYVERISGVMLARRYCPHCDYDLRGLRPDPSDGATVCPECGCAWLIPGASMGANLAEGA
jgi:hypothetical protein